jgi:hypothetical protein
MVLRAQVGLGQLKSGLNPIGINLKGLAQIGTTLLESSHPHIHFTQSDPGLVVGGVGTQDLPEALNCTLKVTRRDPVEGALVEAGDGQAIGSIRNLSVDRCHRHSDEESRYE